MLFKVFVPLGLILSSPHDQAFVSQGSVRVRQARADALEGNLFKICSRGSRIT
jgi:hypothetical protein